MLELHYAVDRCAALVHSNLIEVTALAERLWCEKVCHVGTRPAALLVLLQVVLSTHAIKALSLLDMVMAAKIDALPVQYSPKWERENRAKLGQA